MSQSFKPYINLKLVRQLISEQVIGVDEIVKDSNVQKITFEPFEEKHLSQFVKWFRTPHVKQFWSEPI